jgi:tetratricopeptide (TPR) repeat protein
MIKKKISISSQQNQTFNQALVFHKAGQLDEAEKLYESLLVSMPFNPVLLKNIGAIVFQKGKYEDAVRIIGKSLTIEPNQSDVLNLLGNALQNINRLEDALVSYEKAIAINPNYAEAYSNLGVALQKLCRFSEALACYEKAIAINPNYAEAYANLGNAFKILKRLDEAIASYDQAININPGYFEAYSNRGNVFQDLKCHDEAILSFNCAIAINPEYAEVYSNRGISLRDLNRLDEALASYERAIAINPNYVEAFSNRGIALQNLNRLNEALTSYDKAIAINPNYFEAHVNRGNVLKDLKQLDEALASYDRAIAINPFYAEGYWNKSVVKILNGDYLDGWKLYEWRWRKEPLIHFYRTYHQPLWLGEQLIDGKTLLIYPEQGYGDYIQFIRYIKLIEKLGALVILELPAELISIISSFKGNFSIIENGNKLPDFDYHCPIMSLPLAFKTTIKTIPAEVPYLYASTDRKKKWQQQLGTKIIPRVGLVWSGSINHKNDFNRSISFETFGPLFNLPVEFHCLQKEIRTNDEIALESNSKIIIHTDLLIDFSDTAALIETMDLVISVDTSVSHLAGALGKPVWILLPYAPDYRWMLDKNDTPWYPTAQLFRQSKIGDWVSLINQIRDELLVFFA